MDTSNSERPLDAEYWLREVRGVVDKIDARKLSKSREAVDRLRSRDVEMLIAIRLASTLIQAIRELAKVAMASDEQLVDLSDWRKAGPFFDALSLWCDVETNIDPTPLSEFAQFVWPRYIDNQSDLDELKRLASRAGIVLSRCWNLVMYRGEQASTVDEAPPLSPKEDVGFLGLCVDQIRGEVKRAGYWQTVYFQPDSAEFHTFQVAWNAKEHGATDAAWLDGYPGDPVNRRSVKRRVNEKLEVLDVQLKSNIPPALEKI